MDRTYEYVAPRRLKFDWLATGAVSAAVVASVVGVLIFQGYC